jgi:hypothetical protein
MAEIGIPGTIDNGGPVVFHVNKPFRWHQNETLPGHGFHHGTVSRQTHAQPDGIYISTVGSGTGDCAKLNKIVGRPLFIVVDMRIGQHVLDPVSPNHEPIP